MSDALPPVLGLSLATERLVTALLSRPSGRTSRLPAGLAVVPAGEEARARNLVLLAGLTAWLAYTRLYPSLAAAHATLPACPFLALTGHPCPFCGGTRSFAAMWEGQPAEAARLYPLGPLLFAGSVAALLPLALGLATRRDLRVPVPPAWRRLGAALSVALLLGSWTLKLAWLGA